MQRTLTTALASGLAAMAFLLGFQPAALAQAPQDLFHRAYYLEHEQGDLEQALELYLAVAKNGKADSHLRAQAKTLAQGIVEDLAVDDLARLVGDDTIFFAQVDRPGDQMKKLLGQLGLLGTANQVSLERFAVSPLLIENVLDLRGLALAVTELGPDGQPNGVALLHPGKDTALRGLIETALPAAGAPADPIGGFPTWSIEGKAFVCLTSRLVIASPDPRQIQGVVERLQGKRGGSLAEDPLLARAMGDQHGGLLSFFVNAAPLVPLLRAQIEREAGQDPGVAMALGLLDLDSLQCLSGTLGMDDSGLSMHLALDLAQGHRNVVFNLLRRPLIDEDTLQLVPQGAAFFMASSFNPQGGIAPIERDDESQPVVTLLDLGRELFGNVVDVALFGMPPGAGKGPGLPDVALVVRVNDVERSRALWDLLLGIASQATGARGEPKSERMAGAEVTAYSIQQVPVYVAAAADRLVLSPSRRAVEQALTCGAARSVAQDPVFAGALALVDPGTTEIVAASVARCAQLARPFLPPQEAAQMDAYLPILEGTVVSMVSVHSDTRLACGMHVGGLPDLGGLVTQLLATRKQAARSAPMMTMLAASESRSVAQAREAVAEPATSSSSEPAMLRARFDQLARKGDVEGALKVGKRLAALVEDANALNSFAWALLTEDGYGEPYGSLARTCAVRANELSDYSSWYFLDTLALAEFRAGEVQKAVEHQAKAVELAEGDPRRSDAQAALARYEGALKGRGPDIP